VKPLRALAFFAAGIVVEWLWSTLLPVFGLAPRVVLILTISAASCGGSVAGQCYGFFWGLFLDVLSAHTFGAGALALTLVGYSVGNLRRQMDVSSPPSQMMVVGFVSVAYGLFVGLMGLVFERHFYGPGWYDLVLGTLYNVLVAPIFFAMTRKVLED